MLPFIFGLLTGAFALWLLYAGKRRQIKILDE